MINPKKGDRFTNHLGRVCLVISVYRKIVKLQVVHEEPYTEVWSMEDFLKCNTFFKIPMPKINRTNVAKYLLEFQLNLIGKTLYESKKYENWHSEWTITEIQYNYLRKYAIPLLKKIFKCNKQKAEKTFDWFYMQFGLKIEI